MNIVGLKTYFYTSQGVVKAVDGVSFEIGKKKTVGLVGESGCGKTMTSLSIMKLVPRPGRIVDGKILFKDRNLLDLTDKEIMDIRGKEISMIFQDPMTYLNPTIKIGDQIAEAILRHQDTEKAEVRERVIEVLEKVIITNPDKTFDYYPHQLSGGMRQRVLIAMALSCNPSLLIADEPTTALDVTIQAQILDLMKKIREESERSILLITHDLAIVADICDKVCVMYAGKLVESADVFTLYGNPVHPYTKGLIRSVLTYTEYKEVLPAIEGTVPNPLNFPTGCRFHPRCSEAKPVCRQQEPPRVSIEPQHSVSCWLYA